jgi:endoglucanase
MSVSPIEHRATMRRRRRRSACALQAEMRAGIRPALRPTLLLRGLLLLAVAFTLTAGSNCRAEEQWPLWGHYTQRFLDDQGRVIDHSRDDMTTSEGESYAMFFALVNNDRARFDKVLNWTQVNLAGGDLTAQLPAWSWGKAPDGAWKTLDGNPAADSDLWIAYTLLEAGRLWHEPRYQKIGAALTQRIAQEEVAVVPGLGTTLLAGAHGFHPNESTWIVNPSYMPLPVLARLANADPAGPWSAVIASLKPLLAGGSGAGYAMDWVSAGTGILPAETPAQLAVGVRGLPAVGSYDAIRVYLWLGLADPATPGLDALLEDLQGMANYMKTQTIPPAQVDSTGKVLDANGPVGFSAALAPFLIAKGMKAPARAQMDRVQQRKDPTTGLYGRGEFFYYDQNLILFASGWAEERFRFDREGQLNVRWK